MDQSWKESEPFLPCGWNVFVRAAVQMGTLLKPLVGGGGLWGGLRINTYSSSSQSIALADDSTDQSASCCLLDGQLVADSSIKFTLKRSETVKRNQMKTFPPKHETQGEKESSLLHPSIFSGKKKKNQSASPGFGSGTGRGSGRLAELRSRKLINSRLSPNPTVSQVKSLFQS